MNDNVVDNVVITIALISILVNHLPMKITQIPPSLLEIRKSNSPGYQVLVASPLWRVAMLSASPESTADDRVIFQRHDETDEVFILMQGRCILFLGEGDGIVSNLYAVDLKPFTAYNVKKRTWHTHILSPDARIIIVENQDTSQANSPRVELTADQHTEIKLLVQQLWGEEN